MLSIPNSFNMSSITSPYDDVTFPALSSLPFRKGDPPGAIWGFYESLRTQNLGSLEVQLDELGSLNLLTPNRILKASREEIQVGRVVSLNWPLQKPNPAGYARLSFHHKVLKHPGKHTFDDEISMNTQCGSQWDSFRHWGYYKTGQFYNDLSESELVDANDEPVPLTPDKPLRNGIHRKIVGRGVLLDYWTYMQSKGIVYVPERPYLVTAEDLKTCAEVQNVALRQGDILFIRMGYVAFYNNATPEQRVKATAVPTVAVGVRQTEAEVEWLWNHHFAAVASDTPAFEARPCTQEWNLHDYLLALWGTPIGELFDLEELAKVCKELKRYSFFVTSSPLNIINGIASPPK